MWGVFWPCFTETLKIRKLNQQEIYCSVKTSQPCHSDAQECCGLFIWQLCTLGSKLLLVRSFIQNIHVFCSFALHVHQKLLFSIHLGWCKVQPQIQITFLCSRTKIMDLNVITFGTSRQSYINSRFPVSRLLTVRSRYVA